MTNARALSRVRQDLAAGHQAAAVRRLRTMLAADPNDLELYRLLAEIHRRTGNPAEAGRWGYLTGDATQSEIEAFEQAHPQPWVRLKLLGWPGDPDQLPDATARTRYLSLRRQVSESTVPIQRRPAAPSPGTIAAGAGGAAGAVRRRFLGGAAGTATADAAVAAEPDAAGGGVPTAVPAPRRREKTAGATRRTPAAGAGRVDGHAPAGDRVDAWFDGSEFLFTDPGSVAPAGTPTEAPAGTSAGAPTAPVARPRRRKRPRPGVHPRTFLATTRNFAILLTLIACGAMGSVVVVGLVRALFGISHWTAPLHAIITAINSAVNGH